MERCRCAGSPDFAAEYTALIEAVAPRRVVHWGAADGAGPAFDAGAELRTVATRHAELPPAQVVRAAGDRLVAVLAHPSRDDYLEAVWNDADLFCVDGRRRTEILRRLSEVVRADAVVCLHDAQRARYHPGLAAFAHVRFVSDAFAVATHCPERFASLQSLWVPAPDELRVPEGPGGGAPFEIGAGLTGRLRPDGLIDVCYLGWPSKWGDELKYSLRSLEAHFAQVGTVWIVGRLPNYVDPATVRHVPYHHPVRPEVDPLKRLFANRQAGLSEDYIRFCDDYVLLRDVEPGDFRAYAIQDLNEVPSRGTRRWQKLLWKTFDLVRERGGHGWNFDTHTPKVYNRRRFVAAMEQLRPHWAHATGRYDAVVCDTAYFNLVLPPGATPPRSGPVAAAIVKPKSAADLEGELAGKTFLFFDDTGLNEALRTWLARRFPEPSRYERR